MVTENIQTDFLVIGSGIAGLRAAIELSKRDKQVVLATKTTLTDSNTYYAQGGIAAVDPLRVKKGDDSYAAHVNDTLNAGAGLCNQRITELFTKGAFPEVIQFLLDSGVNFTKNSDSYPYELHQEGGHSQERIYCVGDYTGKAIEETLVELVKNDPNITILENHVAAELITHNSISRGVLPNDECLGAYVLDHDSNILKTIQAKKTFLATGGAGRVFQYTSNPANATGDGIALGFRAGATIANMEFFQFHPTVFYEPITDDPAKRRFLITEALRGQKMGAVLSLKDDSIDDFVLNYHKDGSHATRDVVARAIDSEIKKRGIKHVWLHATTNSTGKSAKYIIENFPQIYEECKTRGIDITTDPIPVVPAAHYTCGGLVVNEVGLTNILGLYAIGEVAYTGLMGANRLASNSLPEAALYGKLAVLHALSELDEKRVPTSIPKPKECKETYVDTATLNQFWDITRSTMTSLCGIERNEQRLKLAKKMITSLYQAAEEIYENHRPTKDLLSLKNITLVSRLIVESALQRKESRGCHYRSDFPESSKEYSTPTIMRGD